MSGGVVPKGDKNILIMFTHGLGDAVQLTCVLRHLTKYHPDWNVYLKALRGKHTVGRGHCEGYRHEREPDFDVSFFHTFDLGWFENYNGYANCPNTKVTNCLREVFGIEPDPELLRYELNWSNEDVVVTRMYLEKIGCRRKPDGRYNAVLLHYQGNTSTGRKDLDHHTAGYFCEWVLAWGHVPIVLDWDRRSPLPVRAGIFCPGVDPGDIWGGFGSGDALRVAALVSQASLFVGVDSGPQKCAGATDTPSIGVWTGHHPVQFFDLCPNFTHLVPADHHQVAPASTAAVAAYFVNHYRYETYEPGVLGKRLVALAARLLGTNMSDEAPVLRGFRCHPGFQDQDLVVIQDVYLDDAYKTYLVPRRPGREIVVDVGAHIGTFARLWHERNPEAHILCVEACPDNLPLLRENVGHFAEVIEGACTYEPDVYLLNSVGAPSPRSTGGSRVVGRVEYEAESDLQYCKTDYRPLAITLHDLMKRYEFDHIDLLKLDCEGSEYSILEHGPVEKIRFILGEYHGFERWEAFRRRCFPEGRWSYGHMSRSGDMGNFHLRNDAFGR